MWMMPKFSIHGWLQRELSKDEQTGLQDGPRRVAPGLARMNLVRVRFAGAIRGLGNRTCRCGICLAGAVSVPARHDLRQRGIGLAAAFAIFSPRREAAI